MTMLNRRYVLVGITTIGLLGCSTSKPTITDAEKAPPSDYVTLDQYPVVTKNIPPRYPERALRDGLEGAVFLRMLVDKAGKVKEAGIIKSDNEIFNRAALEAGKQWEFTPAHKGSEPVPAWITVTITFHLPNKN